MLPAASGTLVGLRSATPKSPSLASTQVVPSTDVSSRYLPVEALPASPQVFGRVDHDLARRRPRAGSEITTTFGCGLGTGLVGASLPHPLPWDWSISWAGPQPNAE